MRRRATQLLTNVFLVMLMAIASVGCSTPKMDVKMSSTANLNLNEDAEPLTAVVRVYQLARAETFESASFDELWQNDLTTIGDAALVKEEFVMNPAETREFQLKPHPDARYIAVMAGFREKQGDTWKDIKPISNSWLGRRVGNDFRISLEGNQVYID